MRVVGGIAKGRKLAAPIIPGTRPTSELIRAAVYNILGPRTMEGARIVDFFAGTGSLGIEGLSRGASWADFVEQHPRQCGSIKSNLKSAGFDGQGRVYCMSVERAIGSLDGPYKVALMDPPYRLEALDPILSALDRAHLMEHEGIVVVGHSKRVELKRNYGTLSLERSRRHGDSVVDFFAVEGI